jgi:hypothetical protein
LPIAIVVETLRHQTNGGNGVRAVFHGWTQRQNGYVVVLFNKLKTNLKILEWNQTSFLNAKRKLTIFTGSYSSWILICWTFLDSWASFSVMLKKCTPNLTLNRLASITLQKVNVIQLQLILIHIAKLLNSCTWYF